MRSLLGRLERSPRESQDVVHELVQNCVEAQAPLTRIEHALVPYTSFVVMPVFALANAGVALHGGSGVSLTDPVMLGVALGLLLGKPLGVAGAAWLAVRTGVASLPAAVTWRQLQGAACLAGIGFTMSLFIANLAFGVDPHGGGGAGGGSSLHLDAAKLGILGGSLLSGALGWTLLARAPGAKARQPDSV